MASITATLVKELRDKTGAGMMDCKKALEETTADLEAAVDWLRTKGLASAAKKAGRAASEGLIGIVIKENTNKIDLWRWLGFSLAVIGAYILGNAEISSQWLGWTICTISCFIWIIMGI